MYAIRSYYDRTDQTPGTGLECESEEQGDNRRDCAHGPENKTPVQRITRIERDLPDHAGHQQGEYAPAQRRAEELTGEGSFTTETPEKGVEKTTRITSYNVCYTKLLRTGDGFKSSC